jgi:hypothetical protein
VKEPPVIKKKLLPVCVVLALSACASVGYTLISATVPVKVANSMMTVTPGIAWNKMPSQFDQPKYEEVWTADGVLLNTLTFYAGVPDGKALIRQRKSAEKQAPLFKSSMLLPEVAEFVESSYRTLTGSPVFNVSALKPASFGGLPGFDLAFDYVLPSDEVKRKGRAVGAIKDGKLYMILYDGTATHYFDAYTSEIEQVVASVTFASATTRKL